MKFALMFQLQTPRPLDADQWHEHDELNIYHEALEQIEFADQLGYDYVFITERHFLEEYCHSSVPEVFLAVMAARTKHIRLTARSEWRRQRRAHNGQTDRPHRPVLPDHTGRGRTGARRRDYLGTVRKCVKVYSRIAERQPEMILRPPNQFMALPQARSVREGRRNALQPWPVRLGVGLSFDAHNKPHLTFEKEEFSLSEAASYFELTMSRASQALSAENPAFLLDPAPNSGHSINSTQGGKTP